MRRRNFIQAASMALTCGSVLPGLAKEKSKPNIVMIVADDLGYGEPGYMGSKDFPTPNIDSIANNGIALTSGYVSAPVCGPSRAGFHTGRYQQRFGHEGNVGGKGDTNGTPIDQLMVGDALKKLGYTTGLVGKFHDGKHNKFWPHNRGFDEFFGFNNGAMAYWVDGKEDRIFRNGKSVNEAEYLTDAFGREAVSFIERHKSKPFFLEIAFNSVHAPMTAKDEDLEAFKHLDEKRRKLVAMGHCMDTNIGKVLDALRKYNLEENTLIVFFSDNGGKTLHTGNNGMLRGEKGGTFEGGIRVPFCAQWKNIIPAGQTSDVPVISLDWFPTFVHAGGGKVDPKWHLDGKNILPLLAGRTTEPPHETLFWRYGDRWAIRHKNWKLVRNGAKDELGLFDLENDISEKNNLADKHPERVRDLRKKWDSMSEEIGPAAWGRYKGKTDRI
jgi:arylsulfatase A-like enzyme